MLLKRKKNRKNHKFENLEFFLFSVHFSKISSRRQAKLITIYRIPGFSFFIFFRFQYNTCFQYAISCFAKAYCNNFASNFFFQVAVCGIHTSCEYRDFISCNIIVDFWYCLVCCIFYSSKSKETSMKGYASTHILLKFRQRIFCSLLRAYCFPNNFN